MQLALHEISALTAMRSLKNQLVEKTGKITQSMNVHKGLVSLLWRLPYEEAGGRDRDWQ
jgi:hypothetical protein